MGRSLLVVDDDPSIRDIVSVLLESEGYAVRQADDGIAAVEELSREKPDLLVLDLMMPRMDGFAVAAEMERRGLRPEVPILVMTAMGQPEVQAARIGAEGCVPKPFDLPVLLYEVDRLAGTA